MILETRFENAEGAATLVDFMPGHQTGSSIVRLVIGERGRVDMRTELAIRFICSVAYPVLDAAGEMPIADVAESDPITLSATGTKPAAR